MGVDATQGYGAGAIQPRYGGMGYTSSPYGGLGGMGGIGGMSGYGGGYGMNRFGGGYGGYGGGYGMGGYGAGGMGGPGEVRLVTLMPSQPRMSIFHEQNMRS